MLRSRQPPLVLCLFACSVAGCSNKAEQKRKALASADAYAANGQNLEAIIEYRRAVQFDPTDGNVRLKLARTYLKAGATLDGLRELLRAGDLLPDNADIQITVGNLLLSGNRFEDARDARRSRPEAAAEECPGPHPARDCTCGAERSRQRFEGHGRGDRRGSSRRNGLCRPGLRAAGAWRSPPGRRRLPEGVGTAA